MSAALQAFQEERRDRFTIDGRGEILLDGAKSLLVAMALHELATNAVKYGALSNAAGRVSIGWEQLPGGPPPWVAIFWQESGGPPVMPPARKGFGSLLIEDALSRGIGKARLDFNPQGVACRFELALG